MRHSLLTQFVLCTSTSLVAARWYEPSFGSGAGPPNTSFVEENRHPDASKSVSFHPIRPNGKPWKWTVNITKIGVSDSTTPPNMYPPAYTGPDAQIVNTVYSFSWESDGRNASLPAELDEQRARSSEPFCYTSIDRISLLPPNVTNLYNDTADPSGDCATTIGQGCVDAIRDAILSEPRNGDGCHGAVNVTAIPECTGNLPSKWYTLYGATPINNPKNIDNGTSRFQNETYFSGDAFHYISSAADNNAGTQNRFDVEQLRVHMVLVVAGDDSFNALCMRVNTSVKATDDPLTGAKNISAGVPKANVWLGISGALVVLSLLI
ncbi:hypothetical protein AC578_8534 [Pseudocercospora eumusae]|uniref:Uncharacterized protein n=1 Tax=Pseudocercospora eumusae TaxID=321146 RepID=A0A139HW87_9PEZI|nr:hypothetical protein AC578_8534 [Pseudocercospora eumusae]